MPDVLSEDIFWGGRRKITNTELLQEVLFRIVTKRMPENFLRKSLSPPKWPHLSLDLSKVPLAPREIRRNTKTVMLFTFIY